MSVTTIPYRYQMLAIAPFNIKKADGSLDATIGLDITVPAEVYIFKLPDTIIVENETSPEIETPEKFDNINLYTERYPDYYKYYTSATFEYDSVSDERNIKIEPSSNKYSNLTSLPQNYFVVLKFDESKTTNFNFTNPEYVSDDLLIAIEPEMAMKIITLTETTNTMVSDNENININKNLNQFNIPRKGTDLVYPVLGTAEVIKHNNVGAIPLSPTGPISAPYGFNYAINEFNKTVDIELLSEFSNYTAVTFELKSTPRPNKLYFEIEGIYAYYQLALFSNISSWNSIMNSFSSYKGRLYFADNTENFGKHYGVMLDFEALTLEIINETGSIQSYDLSGYNFSTVDTFYLCIADGSSYTSSAYFPGTCRIHTSPATFKYGLPSGYTSWSNDIPIIEPGINPGSEINIVTNKRVYSIGAQSSSERMYICNSAKINDAGEVYGWEKIDNLIPNSKCYHTNTGKIQYDNNVYIYGFNRTDHFDILHSTFNEDGSLNKFILCDFKMPENLYYREPVSYKNNIYFFGAINSARSTIFKATLDENFLITGFETIGELPRSIINYANIIINNNIYIFHSEGTLQTTINNDGTFNEWIEKEYILPILPKNGRIFIIDSAVYIFNQLNYYKIDINNNLLDLENVSISPNWPTYYSNLAILFVTSKYLYSFGGLGSNSDNYYLRIPIDGGPNSFISQRNNLVINGKPSNNLNNLGYEESTAMVTPKPKYHLKLDNSFSDVGTHSVWSGASNTYYSWVDNEIIYSKAFELNSTYSNALRTDMTIAYGQIVSFMVKSTFDRSTIIAQLDYLNGSDQINIYFHNSEIILYFKEAKIRFSTGNILSLIKDKWSTFTFIAYDNSTPVLYINNKKILTTKRVQSAVYSDPITKKCYFGNSGSLGYPANIIISDIRILPNTIKTHERNLIESLYNKPEIKERALLNEHNSIKNMRKIAEINPYESSLSIYPSRKYSNINGKYVSVKDNRVSLKMGNSTKTYTIWKITGPKSKIYFEIELKKYAPGISITLMSTPNIANSTAAGNLNNTGTDGIVYPLTQLTVTDTRFPVMIDTTTGYIYINNLSVGTVTPGKVMYLNISDNYSSSSSNSTGILDLYFDPADFKYEVPEGYKPWLSEGGISKGPLMLNHENHTPSILIKNRLYMLTQQAIFCARLNEETGDLGYFRAIQAIDFGTVRYSNFIICYDYLYLFVDTKVYRALINSDGSIGNLEEFYNLTFTTNFSMITVRNNSIYIFGGNNSNYIYKIYINTEGLFTGVSNDLTFPFDSKNGLAFIKDDKLYCMAPYNNETSARLNNIYIGTFGETDIVWEEKPFTGPTIRFDNYSNQDFILLENNVVFKSGSYLGYLNLDTLVGENISSTNTNYVGDSLFAYKNYMYNGFGGSTVYVKKFELYTKNSDVSKNTQNAFKNTYLKIDSAKDDYKKIAMDKIDLFIQNESRGYNKESIKYQIQNKAINLQGKFKWWQGNILTEDLVRTKNLSYNFPNVLNGQSINRVSSASNNILIVNPIIIDLINEFNRIIPDIDVNSVRLLHNNSVINLKKTFGYDSDRAMANTEISLNDYALYNIPDTRYLFNGIKPILDTATKTFKVDTLAGNIQEEKIFDLDYIIDINTDINFSTSITSAYSKLDISLYDDDNAVWSPATPAYNYTSTSHAIHSKTILAPFNVSKIKFIYDGTYPIKFCNISYKNKIRPLLLGEIFIQSLLSQNLEFTKDIARAIGVGEQLLTFTNNDVSIFVPGNFVQKSDVFQFKTQTKFSKSLQTKMIDNPKELLFINTEKKNISGSLIPLDYTTTTEPICEYILKNGAVTKTRKSTRPIKQIIIRLFRKYISYIRLYDKNNSLISLSDSTTTDTIASGKRIGMDVNGVATIVDDPRAIRTKVTKNTHYEFTADGLKDINLASSYMGASSADVLRVNSSNFSNSTNYGWFNTKPINLSKNYDKSFTDSNCISFSSSGGLYSANSSTSLMPYHNMQYGHNFSFTFNSSSINTTQNLFKVSTLNGITGNINSYKYLYSIITSGGKLYIHHTLNDDIRTGAVGPSLSNDTWYHFQLNFNGTNMEIYLDGVLVYTYVIVNSTITRNRINNVTSFVYGENSHCIFMDKIFIRKTSGVVSSTLPRYDLTPLLLDVADRLTSDTSYTNSVVPIDHDDNIDIILNITNDNVYKVDIGYISTSGNYTNYQTKVIFDNNEAKLYEGQSSFTIESDERITAVDEFNNSYYPQIKYQTYSLTNDKLDTTKPVLASLRNSDAIDVDIKIKVNTEF